MLKKGYQLWVFFSFFLNLFLLDPSKTYILSGVHYSYYKTSPKNLEFFEDLKIPTYRIPMDRYIDDKFYNALPNMLNFYNSVRAMSTY